MNKHHQEVLQEIKKHAGEGTKHSWDNNYLGSGHFYYNLCNPLKRDIVKEWLRSHKNVSLGEFVDLLDSLYKGKSYEEKTIAGILLGYVPKLRNEIDLASLDKWLDHLNGWAEVDATCQSNFTAQDLLGKWHEWKRHIEHLSVDKNVNKRRASLVLLTGVVSKSNDKKLVNLAFQTIDRLQLEKDILITKAMSWLLRDLIHCHKKEVEEYLNKNAHSLPRVVVREVKRKLL